MKALLPLAEKIAASLIAIRIAVLRGRPVLRDLRSDIAENLATHLLILLELFHLTSSTAQRRHGVSCRFRGNHRRSSPISEA